MLVGGAIETALSKRTLLKQPSPRDLKVRNE